VLAGIRVVIVTLAAMVAVMVAAIVAEIHGGEDSAAECNVSTRECLVDIEDDRRRCTTNFAKQ